MRGFLGPSRGPLEAAARQDVGVCVEDGLPGSGTGVEHDPVPGPVDLLVGGDLSGLAQHVGEDLRLGGGEGRGVGVVDAGDDQDVGRGLGVDVAEGDGGVGLPDDGGRDLTRDDLAEQAVGLRFSCHGVRSSVSVIRWGQPSGGAA